MATSPIVQTTQEATASLHACVASWGRLFDSGSAARAALEAEAGSVAEVFAAFQLAYEALPRFRTEVALRRFCDASRQLVRSLRGLRLAPQPAGLAEVIAAAEACLERAEAALAAVGGKPAEPQEGPKPVRGIVQRLLNDRGYGFVRADGSAADIFFNGQSVQGVRFATLKIGQPVSFRVVPDPRVPGRMQAVEVQAAR